MAALVVVSIVCHAAVRPDHLEHAVDSVVEDVFADAQTTLLVLVAAVPRLIAGAAFAAFVAIRAHRRGLTLPQCSPGAALALTNVSSPE